MPSDASPTATCRSPPAPMSSPSATYYIEAPSTCRGSERWPPPPHQIHPLCATSSVAATNLSSNRRHKIEWTAESSAANLLVWRACSAPQGYRACCSLLVPMLQSLYFFERVW
ncbi:hypothetical protein ACQJBY_036498 [Aegilops geniculata]